MTLRPYHIIQVLVVIVGIPLFARTLGPAVRPGMVAIVGVGIFAFIAIGAGLLGVVVGLRMRSLGNFVLGLLSCSMGIGMLLRYLMVGRGT